MADYRLDCCGGFPYHEKGCGAITEAPARKEAAEKAKEFNKKNILDTLYAKYGQLIALAERTSHDTRMAYHDKADGVLMAIKIVEGK